MVLLFVVHVDHLGAQHGVVNIATASALCF